MTTTLTSEVRPATTQTTEARGGLVSRSIWTDFTSIAWSNEILSGISWDRLPILTTTLLTSEPRP